VAGIEPAPTTDDTLRRQGLVGLAVLALANLVMVSVMTMTPVHLHHIGSGLVVIGLAISLHIAGMLAPSPVSGWLTDRVGASPTAAAAGMMLIAAAALATAADSPPILAAAMVLLGVGWNLALLSGSALLTAGVSASQRPRREGWGEVAMGIAAAGGGVAAGPVMASDGYWLLAALGAGVGVLVLPLAWYGRIVSTTR